MVLDFVLAVLAVFVLWYFYFFFQILYGDLKAEYKFSKQNNRPMDIKGSILNAAFAPFVILLIRK